MKTVSRRSTLVSRSTAAAAAVFLLSCFSLQAQNGTLTGAAPADPRYERAKTLLAAQKYRLALVELQPLIITSPSKPTAVTNAATYLWAVAALRDSRAREAQPVLQKLREQQPTWVGIPDVILLQAQLAEALGEREQVREILKAMPEGKFVAEQAQLLQRVGFGPAGASTTAPRPVRVAALLPLGLDAVDPRRAQFGQELYAGMRLAADSLADLGTPVELRAYDLDNDTVATKTLLTQPDVLATDLIVGPVYKNPSRLVARAAATANVPVVNPLSEDGTLLPTSPTLYLFRPSVQTQARAAATLAYNRFEPKTAVLLVEETKDDMAFAAAFRAEYEKLGGTIKAEEKVSSQTYRTRMTEKVNGLPLDSAATGVLVVASEEKNAAQQVTGRLERDNDHLPVLAPAAWLEMPELSLDQFNDQEFYFLAPAYRDATSAAGKRFRRAWQQRYGVPPSDFARAGFELLFTFAPVIRQAGTSGLAASLAQRGLQPGALLPTIGYPDGMRDNQGVSILHLTNRLVEMVK
jgi:ABC-type branched-subunit amino acid transport system substrate-binding protein